MQIHSNYAFLTISKLWRLQLIEFMALCVLGLKMLQGLLLANISRSMDDNEVSNKKCFEIKLMNAKKYIRLLFFSCFNSNVEKKNKYYHHNCYNDNIKFYCKYSLMLAHGITKM